MTDESDFIIYRFVNLLDGKTYVGKSTKGEDRFYAHLQCIKEGCVGCSDNLLHLAIRACGLENFDFEILEAGFGSEIELAEAEIRHIERENSYSPNGYNRRAGEHGCGYQFSDRWEKILDYVPPTKIDLGFVEGEILPLSTRRIRSQKKKLASSWAFDDRAVRKLLLTSFPKLEIDKRQRARAARWGRIIVLFFRQNKSSGQVAEEMSIRISTVESALRNMRRAVSGLRTDTGVVRSGRRGRPKKGVTLSAYNGSTSLR